MKTHDHIAAACKKHGVDVTPTDLAAFETSHPDVHQAIRMIDGSIPVNQKVGDAALRRSLAVIEGMCGAVLATGQTNTFVNDASTTITQLLARNPR